MRPKIPEDSLLSDIRLDLRRLKNGFVKMFDEFDKAMALPARERAERLDFFCESFFASNSEFYKLAELAERIEAEADDGKISQLRLHAIHDCADEGLITAEDFNLDGLHSDYTGALSALISGYEPVGRFESEHEKLGEFGHTESDF